MSAPDLSKLSSRMRYAADVLEEFNTDHPNLYNADAPWRPSELLREAAHVEAEEALVEQLARELFAAQRRCFPDRPDLEAWETAWGSTRQNCINLAEMLVESGWHKGAA
ncbi:hypothetical protein [Mycobacterium sp. 23]|uniref:hypothetical protein n=1 Tax=Mycobacterium sp. 23 TaxID=3400424 RepID=UPI003AAAAE4E